ncbi:MAG: hypothetical protein JW881_10505 [Spirochaetales bacterium]|nr:hypothetical protein [Spirochaetales bacterium]
MKQFLIVALFMVILAGTVFSSGIMAFGDWQETVDESDLTGGAGSDVTDTYESASNQTSILITGMNNKNWQVTVDRTDTSWYTDLVIEARRTDSSSEVSGGTTYQIITTSPAVFFTGRNNKLGISIQYRLGGVNLSIPADTSSATITYTLTGT